MASKKLYENSTSYYENKLKRVMERIQASGYKYDWGRQSAWVEFSIYGRTWKFEQSVEKAAANKIKLVYGTDCFAQVVCTLEDLARAGERGIFSLQTILEGLPALPAPMPQYFRELGFAELPKTVEEIRAQYKQKAFILHPDRGGSAAKFQNLKDCEAQAIAYIQNGGKDI
jgi:hypothetical protein